MKPLDTKQNKLKTNKPHHNNTGRQNNYVRVATNVRN